MKQITLFFLLLLSAVAVELPAQATLSFQGVVYENTPSGGALENGNYEMTFQLYEDEAGGVPIWSETQPGVRIFGGVYSVLLGEVNPINVPFDQTYYLGVAVDGAAELTPRTQLTAAPYALSLLGNSNVFPNDGNVGIGTTDPLAALHVAGDVKIDGNLETAGGLGFSFDSLTVDVHTSENLIAGGDVKVADTLFAPGYQSPVRIITGSVDASGNIISGTGFSSQLSTGTFLYTITFDQPFSQMPLVFGNTDSQRYYYFAIRTDHSGPGHISYQIINRGDSNHKYQPAHFMIIGPR